MLDIVYGDYQSAFAVNTLDQLIKDLNLTGSMYFGYPVLPSPAGSKRIDALLTCAEHGVVAIDLSSPSQPLELGRGEWLSQVKSAQDAMFVALNNKFSEQEKLLTGRQLAFEINTLSLFENYEGDANIADGFICTPETIIEIIHSFQPLEFDLLRLVNAAVQRTTTLRPKKKRTGVKKPRSRGSTMKYIEAAIANLDRWQKRAAIELPNGPQRIRGLAGSGKTVVLAQKAAYLHANNPDWNIAVTFNTRSLYAQFRDFITRFYFEQTRDDPDWDKLQISHAWGGHTKPGVYSRIAEAAGVPPKDYSYARSKYARNLEFEGVCNELLSTLETDAVDPVFDAVLIDEAQDIPAPFFQIVYLATRSPKRIIWAYDDLQNLSAYEMSPPEQLFGKDEGGHARVSLQNVEGSPKQDIVLPVCYRNSPWALTQAHALGFGIYRTQGLVQMFENRELWSDIGYVVKSGTLSAGNDVSLIRSPDSTPDFFEKKLKADDAISWHCFDDGEEELVWLADSIKRNIKNDELEHDDILVIVANPLRIKSKGAAILSRLKNSGIRAHLAGVTTSQDVMFLEGSVAVSAIYRAKGNEAPMVYVIGAQDCYSGLAGLSRKRNILFTAITRSRAWVRVSGIGPHMIELAEEAEKVVRSEYALNFPYPTREDIRQLSVVHRDRSRAETRQIESDFEGLNRIVKKLESGELSIDSLPETLREQLSLLLTERGQNDSE